MSPFRGHSSFSAHTSTLIGTIAAIAATQHSVVSLDQLERCGVSSSLRNGWRSEGLIERLGPRSFTLAGSDPTWMRAPVAGYFDLAGHGFVAGRSGARLHELDGFDSDSLDFITPRANRGSRSPATVRSTRRLLGRGDTQLIGCVRVLRPERLILEAPLFEFTRAEIENAIDSAIRKRLISEQRLRQTVLGAHDPSTNGGCNATPRILIREALAQAA